MEIGTRKYNASRLDGNRNLVQAARKYRNFSRIENLVENFLRKNSFNHQSVLSVGCGAGKDVERIEKLFPSAKAYGVDMSREAIKEAKKHSKADFICASSEYLPFIDGLKFDMIVSGHTLDMFPDKEYLKRIIGEITKHSSDGARFYMTFYGTGVQDLELDSCTPIGNTLSDFGWKNIHGKTYTFHKGTPYACGVFWVEEKV